MGSPLGPLMANAFMCSIEERLLNQGKMPNFYKRYVDDTFSIMPNAETAEAFLSTLNDSHPSISFTMELATNGKLPFLGVKIVKHMLNRTGNYSTWNVNVSRRLSLDFVTQSYSCNQPSEILLLQKFQGM